MSTSKEAHAELLAEYPAGYVKSPGKFEGESIATVYFYNLMLDGCSDETIDDIDGTVIDTFLVDAEDCQLWDLPEGTTRVGVWANDSGFVFLSKWTAEEYEKALAERYTEENETSEESETES